MELPTQVNITNCTFRNLTAEVPNPVLYTVHTRCASSVGRRCNLCCTFIIAILNGHFGYCCKYLHRLHSQGKTAT